MTTQSNIIVGVLGLNDVGKTTLINQFVEKKFIDSIPTKMVDQYVKNILYDNNLIRCSIFDFPGSPDLFEERKNLYNKCNVLLICYSLELKDLEKQLNPVIKEVRLFANSFTPIILVGTKADKRLTTDDGISLSKSLDTAKALNMTNGLNIISSYECSGKDFQSVSAVFDEVFRIYYDQPAKDTTRLVIKPKSKSKLFSSISEDETFVLF